MQYAIDSDTILPHDSEFKDTWKQKYTSPRYTYIKYPRDLQELQLPSEKL